MWVVCTVPAAVMVSCVLLERFEHWVLKFEATPPPSQLRQTASAGWRSGSRPTPLHLDSRN